MVTRRALASAAAEIDAQLWDGVVRFWADRAVDPDHGGFLTAYDASGRLDRDFPDKYLVSQTRMVWGFATLSALRRHRRSFRAAYAQGLDFLIDHFWDDGTGGWRWRVTRDGGVVDAAKLTYGQSFALYALADANLATGDRRALEYACRTFDLLERNAADNVHGGWLENMEADWSVAAAGFDGGDRKSLDIHMHLLEAFTSLYAATGDPIHARRLDEVIEIVVTRMVDPVSGAGRNQFDLRFDPRPPLAIRRTWNAERHGETPAAESDTTSYGHNLELSWLLARADMALGRPRDHHRPIVEGLVGHALRFGVDRVNGGVFRDGPHDGPATVRDKEFWQQAEALPGLLDGWLVLRDDRCLDAFMGVWRFVKAHMIDPELGEWRVLVDERGGVLDGAMGNPWKAFYHTGRGLIEAKRRLDLILADGGGRT